MATSDITWIGFCRRYLLVLVVSNLLWEFVQMPLYVLWDRGTLEQIVISGLHCTAGDALIGAASLFASVLLFGSDLWPSERYWRVAFPTISLGLLITIWSEWFNVYVIASWSYSRWMPTLPVFGLGKIGISPIMQWIVLPAALFVWLRRERRRWLGRLWRRCSGFPARLSIKR